MAAQYSANASQNILSNQPMLFTESPVPGNNGLIFHRDGSGIFRLVSRVNNNNGCGCGCRRIYLSQYEVDFHANIAVPTGGTVEEIQLALVVDGEIDPSSIMRFTPAAVEEFGNVGTSIIVSVPSICSCSSVSVRNISTQAISAQNANIIFEPIGITRVY